MLNNPNDMIDFAKAYAHGVLDGYNSGSEDNSYTESNLRSAYSHGYEYGVFLYCDELEVSNAE
jgi:hypothetical protein